MDSIDVAGIPVEVRDYLRELRDIVAARLKGDLRGIWLIGSAAQGAYEHGVSDVDVLVVSRSRWPEAVRQALGERIVHPTLPCPAVGLECVWYAAPDLDPIARPIRFQLNVNGGPGRARLIALQPDDEPQWWAPLDLAAARQVGLPLAGPAAAEAVPEIPWPPLRRAIEESQAFHDDADSGSPNRILNLARLIVLVEDGSFVSKPAGAQRLAARDPELREAVEEAFRARAEGRWMDPALGTGLSRRLREALERRPG